MKRRFLKKKPILAGICCVLAAVTFFSHAPSPVLEALYVPEYISDLRIFYSEKGEGLDAALKACRAQGYTPVEHDLNAGTDSKYVVLGYKTTKMRDQAITDVRTLYMGLGYEQYDLGDVLKEQEERMQQLARELIVCCKEFRERYQAGSPHAKLAYEIFNHFILDDLDDTPMLGDFLMSDVCMPIPQDPNKPDDYQEPKGVEELTKILNRASSSFTNLLYVTMVSAVADYNPDSEYVEGEYEIDVAVPETEPPMTVPPEVASSIAQQIVESQGWETTASETETTAETGEPDSTRSDSAEAPVTTEESAAAETTADTGTTAVTELTETAAAVTETTETTAEAAVLTSETTETAAETTAFSEDTDSTDFTDDTDDEDDDDYDDDETTDTEETALTTEPLTPNEIVRLVLNCDKTYSTWAERISLTGMAEYYKKGEIISLFDAAYQNQALNIKAQLQDFAKRYQEAQARYNTYGDELYKAAAEEFKDSDDMLDLAEQIRRKACATGEMNECGADLSYITAYQILDRYRYDDTMSVAQYIVKIGCNAYGKYEELQEIYPLLAAMTDGQIQMVQANGLLPVIMALNNTDDVLKNAKDMLEKIDKQFLSYNGRKYISVFEGVRSEEEKIAVTSALKAQQTAGAVYDTVTEPLKFDQGCDSLMNSMTMISQIAGALTGFIMLGGIIIGKLATGSIMMIGFGTCWAWMMTGGFWVAIGGLACFTCMMLPLIAGVIMLMVMLIKAVVQWVRDLIGWEPDPEWEDIPGLVFDYVDGYYVNYHPVYGSDGKLGDLNAGDGKRWCAVYYTKAVKIGSPMVVPEAGSPFTLSNTATKVTGYTPLREFDTVIASNLNSYVRKGDVSDIFLHYKTENDVNVPINEGKEADTGKAKYITGLMLSTGNTETEAKTALTKKGYTVYPKNLTPRYDKALIASDTRAYCYIGYMTSDSSENAVTDIRICPQESADALTFGTGGYSNVGTTQEGDSLYYTCDKNMGEPITENFEIYRSVKDAPDGWEPVLTFGGFPYDFNLYNNNDRGMSDDAYSLFLYFLPDKIYTPTNEDGSPATQYLGGFAILEMNFNVKSQAKESTGATCTVHEDLLGRKIYNYNLVGIANNCQIATCNTYNPKRAIYGMSSYVASPKGTAVSPCLGVQTSGASVACDVRANNLDAKDKCFTTDHCYGILPVTSYTTDDWIYDKIKKYPPQIQADDFEYANYWTAPYSKAGSYIGWTKCELRKKALYVRGYSPDMAPLMPSEVVFTQTKLEADKSAFAIDGTKIDPAEYYSIQDFKTPNATAPHNLSFVYSKEQRDKAWTDKQPFYGDFYIYLKRKPEEKPYISSIAVKSYEIYDYLEKDAKMKLDDIGEDEMASFNSAGHDICVMSLLAQCTDEIYPFNIASLNATEYHEDTNVAEDVGHWFANLGRDIGGWFAGFFSDKTENELERYNYEGDIVDNVRVWQDDLEKYVSNSCTYMGFSRTDNEMEAIKGIIKYKPADGKAPSTIKVDGVTYTRCGSERDKVYDYLEGSYYIYTTKDNGASPGRPITAVTLNTKPIAPGAQTARTATAPNTVSKADPNCMNFIHAYYSDEGMYMDAVYIGRGDSERHALCDLLNMDCCNVVLYNLHNTKEDDYAFIGITKYQPLLKSDLVAKSSAVRDIRIVTESGFELEKYIGGRRYKRAIDKYSYNNDFSQAVCLNDADGAYLYYSSAGTETPYDRIGIAEKDRVPPTENGLQVWENVLTESGVRYNLNNSFITFSKDDSDIVCDNRVYLFARRLDGSVRFGSEIVGGHCEEMQKYGELLYTRN